MTGITAELEQRIITWQEAWLQLHRSPIPADQAGHHAYNMQAAHLLGVAYVLLFDARHSTDTSAAMMAHLNYPGPRGPFDPVSLAMPDMPYPPAELPQRIPPADRTGYDK